MISVEDGPLIARKAVLTGEASVLQGGNAVASFQTALQSAGRAQSRAIIKKPVFSLKPNSQ